jgi:hypothetical protein
MSAPCQRCGEAGAIDAVFCASCGLRLSRGSDPMEIELGTASSGSPARSAPLGRERQPRRRAEVVVLGIVLAVVVATLVATGGSSRQAAAPAPTSAAPTSQAGSDAPTTAATATTSSAAVNSDVPVPTTTPPTSGDLGPLLPTRTHTKLLLVDTTGNVSRVDLDTGHWQREPWTVIVSEGMFVTGDTIVSPTDNENAASGPVFVQRAGHDKITLTGTRAWPDAAGGFYLLGLADQSRRQYTLWHYDGTGERILGHSTYPVSIEEVVPVGPDTVLLGAGGSVYVQSLATDKIVMVGQGTIRWFDGSAPEWFTCDATLACSIRSFTANGRPTASRPTTVPSGEEGSPPLTILVSPDGKLAFRVDPFRADPLELVQTVDGSRTIFSANAKFPVISVPLSGNLVELAFVAWTNDSRYLLQTTLTGMISVIDTETGAASTPAAIQALGTIAYMMVDPRP